MRTNGRWYTCSVVGWYCMTSPTSSRCTTAPGESARSLPTLNASRSTIEGMPPLWRRSPTKLRTPRTRLMPPVSNARLIAAGLLAKKLVGRRALVRIVVANGPARRAGGRCALAQLVDEVAHGLRGGQVAVLDPREDRVARPRRVGETPVVLGGRRRGAPRCNATELQAQLPGGARHGSSLAQRRHHGTRHVRGRRACYRLAPVDRRCCLAGVRRRVRVAHGLNSSMYPVLEQAK